LNNSVPGGTIDNYGCYLNFTPQVIGFYAAAVTAEDFIILPINISSTAYLSQVPIQFIFHVYNSTYPCVTGPIYIGDLVPGICISIQQDPFDTDIFAFLANFASSAEQIGQNLF
jgi:hypothetical protein